MQPRILWCGWLESQQAHCIEMLTMTGAIWFINLETNRYFQED